MTEALAILTIKKAFTSYAAAGLLTTGLSAVLFVRVGWLSLPLLGLTVGIATRSLSRTFTGLVCSAGLGLILLFVVPRSTSLPPPPALDWYWDVDMAVLAGCLAGAIIQLPERELQQTAAVSVVVSLLLLFVLGGMLRSMLPPELRMLEKWEYATILAAVPLLGLGVWLPVDVIAKGLAADD